MSFHSGLQYTFSLLISNYETNLPIYQPRISPRKRRITKKGEGLQYGIIEAIVASIQVLSLLVLDIWKINHRVISSDKENPASEGYMYVLSPLPSIIPIIPPPLFPPPLSSVFTYPNLPSTSTLTHTIHALLLIFSETCFFLALRLWEKTRWMPWLFWFFQGFKGLFLF
jgi:hypothetical protein